MKLTKKEFKKYYNDKKFDLYNSDIYNLTVLLEKKGLINYTIEFREDISDNWLQAEASMKVGNGKFNMPVILDYGVELWEDMSFDEVFDTFQEIQAKYINLTTEK